MKNNAQLEPKKEFNAKNNKKYEVKSIINNMVYSKEVESQIPELYYLILWKSYPEEKNT